MRHRTAAHQEGRLALGYTTAAWIGLATDGAALTLLEHMGLEPAWARVVSLAAAMQVTFWINGLWVFRCISRRNWPTLWTGYMVSSALGNFCNYWAFVTLVSLHSSLWSNRWLDLALGGMLAWTVNYGFARLLIFGGRHESDPALGGMREIRGW